MTDMRERVARAICKHDALGLNPDEPQVNRDPVTGEPGLRPAWMEHIAQADAALLACGYAEMRKALKDAATAYEDLHDFANDSVCKWSDETQKHCPGVCDYIGCLATHIKNARSILERTGEK